MCVPPSKDPFAFPPVWREKGKGIIRFELIQEAPLLALLNGLKGQFD